MTVRNRRLVPAIPPGALVALVALLAAGSAPEAGAGRPAMDPGRVESLRGHVLTGTDGRTLRVLDLAGEVVVVNFWATWCRPCRREMPLLDAMNARLTGDSGRVLAVSVDREPERVHRFVADHELSLPVFVDGPEGLARTLDLAYLPYTVVLDREGRVAFAGAASSEADWKRMNELVVRLVRDRSLRSAKEDSGS